MHTPEQSRHRRPGAGRRQAGGLTVFTGIFVLILMTLMLLYATRVGVSEQRVSANELRQKLAFHAAESAVDQGVEYILANAGRIFSTSAGAAPDGNGGQRAGWFADDGVTPGWQPCSDALVARDDHPCGGDIPASSTSYFYDDPATAAGSASGADSLPIDTGVLPADTTARLSVVLCLLDPEDLASLPCQVRDPAATEEEVRESLGVVQLMGYGYSDCTDISDVSTCLGEARIARPLSSFKNASGTPTVPLTTRSTFPPGGTAEVVPHPNAAGIGVPLSVWSNANTSCSNPPAVAGQGSWSTCQMHEWYGRDSRPDGVACDNRPCRCTLQESISYSGGNTTYQGIDILEDEAFPCDLFEFYFGVPRESYEVIKGSATIISDCDNLGPESSGFYWVSGSDCRIRSNTVIGSPEHPVILVSAATSTRLSGNARIFGILYIFDGEDPDATLDAAGTNTVYGAVMVDATMGNYNGTFQIVYVDSILSEAAGQNGVGTASGGWRDFGLPDWQ
jgi:hypothetical protein